MSGLFIRLYLDEDVDVFAARRLPGELVRRLLVILNSVTAGEMKNQVRYL